MRCMLTYLASPYSHPDPIVRAIRFRQACKAAAKLMRAGEAVFSPIAHSHSVEQQFDEVEGFEFWMRQDIPILRHCSVLKVLRLPGWKQSKGIAHEMAVAKSLYIPIRMIDP